MGSCNFKCENNDSDVQICKNNFEAHFAVGKGGFGRVWKVQLKKTREVFAMKEMSKARILSKRSVNSVMNERKLLSIIRHPFIVNMQFAFQDRDNLYLLMDYKSGGDLRYHITRYRNFAEKQTKFLVMCILTGLEYLHNNGIIHRDVKPENLVFDQMGYLHLTDFGIARVWNPENARDTSGTPGYMAPEVMCRQNHGVAADYFAVGVIMHELMMCRRPYQGKSRKEIRDQMLAKQARIKAEEVPQNWSLEAADFVNKLLQRKPSNRLGVNGPGEVKSHPWLLNQKWEKLLRKRIKPPFVPSQNQENFDPRQNSAKWRDENSPLMVQSTELLQAASTQNLFAGYFFDINQQNVHTENSNTK